MSKPLAVYFVSVWEHGPGSYQLEVCDDLWGRYECIDNVPEEDVERVEMELMHKWKDEMAKNGFVPAPTYEMEMEG